MATKEHGTIVPSDKYPVDPEGRGTHVIQGYNDVADETARTALTQTSADRGRAVHQTAGTSPGWYIADGVGGWFYMAGASNAGGAPTSQNKRMPAQVTSGDGDQACGVAVQSTPALNSHVFVLVNGQERSVGDGVLNADSYFSDDGGSSARNLADIAAGDTVHWNGSVAGFQLTVLDEIEFDFDALSDGGVGGVVTDNLVTTGPVTLYVDAAAGDDADSGDVSNPLATLVEAETRIPYIVAHTVIINVGTHAGNGYAQPTFRERILRANIYIVGTNFTELVSSTAALGGSGQEVVVSSGLSVNAYRGKTIEILSGTAIGDRRTIRNNTATDIVPVERFTTAISVSDTYKIVEPTAVIEVGFDTATGIVPPLVIGCGTGPAQLFESKSVPNVQFINLAFDNSAGSFMSLKFASSFVVMAGVEIRSTYVSLGFYGSSVNSGYDSWEGSYDLGYYQPVVDLAVTSRKSWLGWGTNIVGPTIDGGTVRGFFVGGACVVCNVTMWIMGGNLYSGLVSGVLLGSANPYVHLYRPTSPDLLVYSTGADGAVDCEQGRFLLQGPNLDISGLNGIVSAWLGEVVLNGTAGAVTGTCTNLGMMTREGGRILLSQNTTPSIAGPAGDDFSEDGGSTIRSNAALTAGTVFQESGWGSQIGRSNVA